jgi:membrane-associated protein
MDQLREQLSWLLHIQDRLEELINVFGVWTYVILFLIIFCETGLVVTPFLPGDSLLFAAGAFSALNPNRLNIWAMLSLLCVAAILGDTVNYWFGAWIGPRAFSGKFRFFKQEHLIKTEAFYETYGAKAVVLARFVPIVRTFIPFVAGIGAMNYRRFILYNVVGGVAWVGLCTGAGYWFGNIPWVKRHFEAVVVAIILLSVAPLAWEYFASRRRHPSPLPVPGELQGPADSLETVKRAPSSDV